MKDTKKKKKLKMNLINLKTQQSSRNHLQKEKHMTKAEKSEYVQVLNI